MSRIIKMWTIAMEPNGDCAPCYIPRKSEILTIHSSRTGQEVFVHTSEPEDEQELVELRIFGTPYNNVVIENNNAVYVTSDNPYEVGDPKHFFIEFRPLVKPEDDEYSEDAAILGIENEK